MKIESRGPELGDRLKSRLENVSRLRCAEHGQPIVAVTIRDRENGWFDTTWVTCCDLLQRQAATIVKERC